MDNVHTYAHARRVYNAPKCNTMHSQTFLWPTSTPLPSYPDYNHRFSQYGPPVRHFEDLIACHYLSIHRPDVFKLQTSAVLDSVSDRDFDAYELRKKQEAKKRFEEKYSSYKSSFDRQVENMTKTGNANNKRKKKPKRSKFFDSLISESQRLENVVIHYAEEIILPPACEAVVECILSIPALQYATVFDVVQPQRAIITVEDEDEFQEQTSHGQWDCDDHWSTNVVKAVRWSKRKTGSYSLFISHSLKRKDHLSRHSNGFETKDFTVCRHRFGIKKRPASFGQMFCFRFIRKRYVFPFVTVQRNFKKRRRKCESEHAH